MVKKFFDIMPPDLLPTKTKEEKSVLAKSASRRKKRGIFFKSSIILVAALVLTVLFGFFFFPKAEIEIKPKEFPITLEDKVTIDLSADNYSFEDKVIPGSIFEDERTLEKDFPSTGKTTAEKKARGAITVYNEYSTSPRTFVPSRFVSADGKLFWSTKSITVPGYKKDGSKIIPGEAEVVVEAAEAGEDYNIGSTTFAMPGLAGSALYTAIYAKSFSPMTGGSIGEASSITRQDLDSAENSLTQDIKDLSKDALSARLPIGFILLDETISQHIEDLSTQAKAGDAVDSFKYKADIKSSAFSFKKEYLDSFIKTLMSLNLKEDEEVKALKVSYSSESIDSDSGKLILDITVQVEVYKSIDTEELKRALLGKTKAEAEMLLRGEDNISGFTIKNKPFLRKRIPDNKDKVDVRVSLD